MELLENFVIKPLIYLFIAFGNVVLDYVELINFDVQMQVLKRDCRAKSEPRRCSSVSESLPWMRETTNTHIKPW